jgi:mono/diheme cytochrome c family protein
MYPTAPQLWKKHTRGNVVGVSDDEAGETYWKVANGIRLTGMPAYQHVLSDTQMWQVSLLLKNADQQLPDPVKAILIAPKP